MKKFKKIYIEITNVCNLSCSFCPTTTRKSSAMTLNNFEQILIDISKHTNYIYLHVKGEPMFHPNFSKILKICEKYDLKVCLTTNGTLINKFTDVLLESKSIHKLHISLHSFEANSLDITINEYLTEIVKLIKVSPFITVLRLWNDGGANDLNDKILNLLKQELNNEFTLNPCKTKHTKISNNCYIEQGDKFIWPSLNGDVISDKGFCYALRNQIAILVCGTVVPCCLDNNGDIPLGNIFEKSLDEIINSKQSKELYSGFSNKKLVNNLCKTCGFISRFDTK